MMKKAFALLMFLGSIACGKSDFSYKDAVSHVLQESSTIKLENILSKSYQIKEISLITHLPNGAKGTFQHKVIYRGKLSQHDFIDITTDPSEFNFSYKFECYLPTVWEPNTSNSELQITLGYHYKNIFDASSQNTWSTFERFHQEVNQIFHVFHSHYQKEKEGKFYYEFQSHVNGYHDFPILGWIVEKSPQIELHILIKNENAFQILTAIYVG